MTAGKVRTAGIVGTGLIGASAGLALRAAGWRVVGYDRSREASALAEARGAIERSYSSVRAVAASADLVIVAVPPAATVDVVREVLDAAPRAVTDVASVKANIVRELGDIPAFLGGHPMAGSEQAGPGAARPDLFSGATWALTRTPATDPRTVEIVTAAVEAAGAVVMTVDAESHDRMVAVSSHSPHVVAAALVLALCDTPEAAAISQLLGGGWRGVTRVASGDPEMWADILSSNATNVRIALRPVADALAMIEAILAANDVVALQSLLRRAAALRASLERPAHERAVRAVG